MGLGVFFSILARLLFFYEKVCHDNHIAIYTLYLDTLSKNCTYPYTSYVHQGPQM